MREKRRAALRILLKFVHQQGGGGKLFKAGHSYRWRSPEGRVAAIGWE